MQFARLCKHLQNPNRSKTYPSRTLTVVEAISDHRLDRAARSGESYCMTTSIIIVNWNGKHHLEVCLPALNAQTLAPDEVIVVDNGSTDASIDFLKQYHPRVRIVELSENRGFAGGNVAGLDVASGDYIVLLNNDTRPERDWLERLVACCDSHPDVGLVASHITDWAGATTDSAGDGCRVTGRGFQMHRHRPTTVPPPSAYVFSACAGGALYRRSMLDAVGFLDETFFMNCEDTDLAFRAQLRGWKAYYCDAAIVRHRVSASQGERSQLNLYYNTRNHIWTYGKCMPKKLVKKYGWLFVAEVLLKGWVALWSGRGIVYLRAVADAVWGLPGVFAARRAIQEARLISDDELDAVLTYPTILPQRRVCRTAPRRVEFLPAVPAHTPIDSICAVIVTYRPDQGFATRLSSIARQVDRVFIVDNGTPGTEFDQLTSEVSPSPTVIRNNANLGIATALNQGIAAARDGGFHWAITLDQDSVPANDMVRHLLDARARYQGNQKAALFGPTIVETRVQQKEYRWLRPHRSSRVLFERVSCDGPLRDDVTFVITSGVLMDLDAYRSIGPFRDEFFIDYVDHEYCLRAKRNGYAIVVVRDALLYHSLGNKQERSIGRLRIRPTFHGAERLYYIHRNGVRMRLEYGLAFPHWFLFDVVSSTYNLLRVLTFEDHPLTKLSATIEGVVDGVRGRMGKRRRYGTR